MVKIAMLCVRILVFIHSHLPIDYISTQNPQFNSLVLGLLMYVSNDHCGCSPVATVGLEGLLGIKYLQHMNWHHPSNQVSYVILMVMISPYCQ